jgi:hypothetical protein
MTESFCSNSIAAHIGYHCGGERRGARVVQDTSITIKDLCQENVDSMGQLGRGQRLGKAATPAHPPSVIVAGKLELRQSNYIKRSTSHDCMLSVLVSLLISSGFDKTVYRVPWVRFWRGSTRPREINSTWFLNAYQGRPLPFRIQTFLRRFNTMRN